MFKTSEIISPLNESLCSAARALVSSGALNIVDATSIQKQAHKSGENFIALLIKNQVLDAKKIAHALSIACVVPLCDLSVILPGRISRDFLQEKICTKYKIVPLIKCHNRLLVATADPSNLQTQEDVNFITQAKIEWVAVEWGQMEQMLAVLFTKASDLFETTIGSDFTFENNSFAELTNDVMAYTQATESAEIEDAPIVRFLQKMLLDAVSMRASDLHFEPYEHSYRVRFRIDGELREIANPPLAIREKLASRIKILSRLDISEKRLPQDGRMKLKIGSDRFIEFRVSTLPTLFGEKIVVRILDPASVKLGIDALGYEPEEKERLMKAIAMPYGMILVTGPTGSGKTVSLYTCLSLLNKAGVNIATVEDPCEINLPGVNQVNINEKAGLTFSGALKSFLRQDPDIIMVGEIRDLETSDIAIKAAQTGHLVLSTLHTNDAPATLTRLRNMGVAAFNIASSVTLITAQRLLRKLCEVCKESLEIPTDALLKAGFNQTDLDGCWKPYRAVGCSGCNNGYKGRIGVYQVMPISEEIERIILRDGSSLEIAEQSRREGVRSLRQSALHKVKQGITSIEEATSSTNET
jgi:type IV pilus assembly protein PilB